MAVSQSLTLTQSSQSISGNYSKVRILWKSTQTGASYNGYTRTAYYYVSINGGAETRYSVSYTLPKASTKTIVDTTITVNHKTDGKGTIKVRTYMDTDISAGVVEQSKSLTLDTIPRVTTPTLSASSIYMGESLTISTPRASSSFTHDLAYKFGSGSWVSIATGVATSKSWTVADVSTSIPKATSGVMTIRCITKNGSTTIGTKTVTLTVKVPTSYIPTVTSVNVTELTEGLSTQFGAFIQNKSKLTASIVAAGIKGSTITAYQSTLLGVTYTAATWTSEVLNSKGVVPLKVRVKDSRGRWSAYNTQYITIRAYSPPTINSLTAYRCDADGNESTEGTRVKIKYSYTATYLENNATTGLLQYKLSLDTNFTDLDTDYSILQEGKELIPDLTFTTDNEYDIRLTVTDWFGETATKTVTVPTGAVILDIKANGKGIAFGKAAEQDGIEFGWPIVDRSTTTGWVAGHLKTPDGLLMQWGNIYIKPTAANTPTQGTVTFPKPFTNTPAVFVTPYANAPEEVYVGMIQGANYIDDNLKEVGIMLTSANTNNRRINWLAIGPG